ncbi:hypothetical protein P43SY_003297 [Pythium insidiosum]|uniref:Tyrosinase copper-binding domain-containing protein n=1 Tax=Pythium insidiosum TaxID=114742 RepID=A0AAD5M5S5_PYTIN|nr:hypothetical protein P43SY_003297 [Pythium insidiosum]
MMSSTERQIYKDAVATSFRSGEFFEFTKLHVHQMSEQQAHDTCAFFIWHKRYLLGFENMLRAQTKASRCVTVPYWDAMTEYTQMVNGQCSSIYDCSPIVRELGGEQSGPKTMTVNGFSVTGSCYTGWSDYCDDSKATCGCVPRDDLNSKVIPSGAGYQGLFDSVAFSTNFEDFTKAIQWGLHNDMHGQVGGFMSTFYSPNDPLFFSWHATIDMLLYVYHQCHLADGLSSADLEASVYAFSQDGDCRYSAGSPAALLRGDLIQRVQRDGVDYDAQDNPVIGKYFRGLSSKISDLLGFRALGSYSYRYEIPDAFKKHLLLKKALCPAFVNAVSPPTQSTTTKPTVDGPGTVRPGEPSPRPTSERQSSSGSGSRIEEEAGMPEITSLAPQTSKPAAMPSYIDQSLVIVNESDASCQSGKYWDWVSETRSKLITVYPGNHSEVAKQLQYLECICFHEEFGIHNFTKEFIQNFKLQQKEPVCLKKVEEVKAGKKEVVLSVAAFDAEKVEIRPGVTPAPPVTEPPSPGSESYSPPTPAEGDVGYDTSTKTSTAAPTSVLGSPALLSLCLVTATLWGFS